MTETASDPTSRISGDATPTRPATNEADAWKVYWQAQNMPWRTEPEIPADRQAYLAERRAITPDIEWLLATHESHGSVGPVNWKQEKEKWEEKRGLDLRGADLSGLDLSRLPLAFTQAGLT